MPKVSKVDDAEMADPGAKKDREAEVANPVGGTAEGADQEAEAAAIEDATEFTHLGPPCIGSLPHACYPMLVVFMARYTH